MSRLSDEELPLTGTVVVVEKVEDLVIYQGELDPELSAPTNNWYLDDDPPTTVPSGLIAIRQLKTGCLALMVETKARKDGLMAGLLAVDLISIFTS